MFYGQYRHSLDEKGRLIMPAKYREPLADGLMMTRAIDDPCILVYTRTEWPGLERKLLEKLPVISNDIARRAQRVVFSNASEEEISKQGRISIPFHLREYAGIEKDVVIAGNGSWLEIWSLENWEKHARESEEKVTGEALAQFGI
ncbi:MAG: division/cell wall cluster transcriptional repressor MraZ [Actinobacteria bacterium]|nr:division/cell wall cluster transcriptional repressor MraZ [Actinomycetota bacterium]